jgi:hypothetical protein
VGADVGPWLLGRTRGAAEREEVAAAGVERSGRGHLVVGGGGGGGIGGAVEERDEAVLEGRGLRREAAWGWSAAVVR